MKRNLLCLLLFLSALCAGCAQQQSGSPITESTTKSAQTVEKSQQDRVPDSVVDPLLEHYLSELDILETPFREYGESVSHIQMDEDFVARILYPKGDLEQLDQAVESWVLDTAAYYESESVGSSAGGDPAELTVDYSSYLVNEALVGVKLSGVFERPYLAHPVDVSASFNASKETGKLLTLADLLVPDSEDTLRKVLADDGYHEDAHTAARNLLEQLKK